jgi:hypothetical protein
MEKLEALIVDKDGRPDRVKIKFVEAVFTGLWKGKTPPKGVLLAQLWGVIGIIGELSPTEFAGFRSTCMASTLPSGHTPSQNAVVDVAEEEEELDMNTSDDSFAPEANSLTVPEVERGPGSTSANAAKKHPHFCKSLWRNTTCQNRENCPSVHERCNLVSCRPLRDPRCKSFHDRAAKLATSGASSRSARPAPGNSNGVGKVHPGKAVVKTFNADRLRLQIRSEERQRADLRIERLRNKDLQSQLTLSQSAWPQLPSQPPQQQQPQHAQLHRRPSPGDVLDRLEAGPEADMTAFGKRLGAIEKLLERLVQPSR